MTITRRELLKATTMVGALSVLPSALAHASTDGPDGSDRGPNDRAVRGPGPYGPLGEPDENGIRLPEGFTSRVVAESLALVPGTTYMWHAFPDGGAVYDTDDGGWIYTSNSEVPAAQGGGVSSVRFDADGNIVDAYRTLSGTRMNCAGGKTPWQTWLSCEEVFGAGDGMVFETDPFGEDDAVALPAMGLFTHEAAAVDPIGEVVFLTEDNGSGRFYRFTPDAYPDLTAGTLEVMVTTEDTGEGLAVSWIPAGPIEEPQSNNRDDRARAFDGGEGLWYDAGAVYFTAKGEDRVYRYDITRERLHIIYDAENFGGEGQMAPLTGVDNVVVSDSGDIVVAEDGGNMELVIISAEREITQLVKVENQDASELTGPAFSPDGTRLFFSSQRGGSGGIGTLIPNTPGATGPGPGITYEITGPFRAARRAAGRSASI